MRETYVVVNGMTTLRARYQVLCKINILIKNEYDKKNYIYDAE